MDKCLACSSTDTVKAKNDCGHFKCGDGRPLRMYQYRCISCGFIATYAKTPEQEAKKS